MDNNTKHKILFVCHGNICRSPMAEFVMKDLVKKVGLEDSFMIESAATSTEEIGNSVYPPARRKLAEHGIGCAGKTARQMTRSDYDFVHSVHTQQSVDIVRRVWCGFREVTNVCTVFPPFVQH